MNVAAGHAGNPSAGQVAPGRTPPVDGAEDAATGVVAPVQSRLGRRIRDIRLTRGLTLVQLAEACGLSHPFLSQVERGLAQPSIASLERIARALGTSQLELFALTVDEVPMGRCEGGISLVRRDEGVTGPFSEGTARLLVTGPRRFKPLQFSGCNTEPGDYYVHDEDEFLTVIAGAVTLDLQGEGSWQLALGDAVYYPGGVPHRWWSADGGAFEMLLVKESPRPEPRRRGRMVR